MDRRRFLRMGAAAGIAGAAGVAWPLVGSVLGGSSPDGLPAKPSPPERRETIVEEIASPLRVAQWYDYWPGRVLQEFRNHVASTYGVTVDVVQDVYASNEELFSWLTQGNRVYDVVFPTQHAAEAMWRSGILRPIVRDLVPNLANLFPEYAEPTWALDRRGNLFAAAYMAGTTGIGYRTDLGWTLDDVEGSGWDLFWDPSLGGVALDQKRTVLDDPREVLGLGFKKLGYDATGTPIVDEGQWSLSTSDPARIAATRDALVSARPGWLGFHSANAAPFLVNGVTHASHVWSSDLVYAARPHTSSPQPVDFAFPAQGFARWVDSACIPARSSNLFTAHVFIDFLLRGDIAGEIADWVLGTTPNASAYDLLTAYPTVGWDPREDRRLYPDAATLRRSEYARAVSASTDLAYASAWNEIRFG